MVKAVRANGTPVWYVVYDAGHEELPSNDQRLQSYCVGALRSEVSAELTASDSATALTSSSTSASSDRRRRRRARVSLMRAAQQPPGPHRIDHRRLALDREERRDRQRVREHGRERCQADSPAEEPPAPRRREASHVRVDAAPVKTCAVATTSRSVGDASGDRTRSAGRGRRRRRVRATQSGSRTIAERDLPDGEMVATSRVEICQSRCRSRSPNRCSRWS